MGKLSTFLSDLRPLRVGLYSIALVFCFFYPGAGTPTVYEGIGVLSTLIIPSLVPLVFMVLLLDSLMNRVWMGDNEGEVRKRYKTRMITGLLITLIVLIVWTPFYIAIW